MSRTIRRNQQHLIRYHCGSREDFLRDPPSWLMRGSYYGLTPEQAYRRYVALFCSDYNSTMLTSPPRWFVQLFFNRPHRREVRRELERCLRNGTWDDHLDPRQSRGGAQWRWW